MGQVRRLAKKGSPRNPLRSIELLVHSGKMSVILKFSSMNTAKDCGNALVQSESVTRVSIFRNGKFFGAHDGIGG